MGDALDDAKADAGAGLWKRFDAGEVGANEIQARLQLLDRAGDAAAVTAAATGSLPLRRRFSRRTVVLASAFGLLVLGLSGAAVVQGVTASESPLGGGGQTVGTADPNVGGPVVVGGIGVGGGEVVIVDPPPPIVAPTGPGCDNLTEFEDTIAAAGVDTSAQPTSEALLTDPAFVPEGFDFGDDYDIQPGTDPDIAMSITAGSPLPVQIAARDLDGDLAITMRTFVYDSYETALASIGNGPSQALCDFDAEFIPVADHPELLTLLVTQAPIPPTAFTGWHRGDRRFSVGVQARSAEPEDMQVAADLAARIAVAELDAAAAVPARDGDSGDVEPPELETRPTVEPDEAPSD